MLNSMSPVNYEVAVNNFLNIAYPAQAEAHVRDGLAYAKGETVIQVLGLSNCCYIVTSGELAIYVNGLPVDIIEAGEYFDESIWLGGEAIALTDCVVRAVKEPQPKLIKH